jgi:hypothetical protein
MMLLMGKRFLAIIWGLLGRLQVQSGYSVYVNEALGVLEQTAPDAGPGHGQFIKS